jgi:SAM-dependent methyltransferase
VKLPVAGYIHPRAEGGGDLPDYHTADIASDSLANHTLRIAQLCSPYLGDNVVDVGAGFGAITEHLASGRTLLALDPADECRVALEKRFSEWPNVTVRVGDIEELEPGDQFESIVMINVLEHIVDDAGALRTLASHLTPSGTLVLYVPAYNFLYTNWDRAVGHQRRYSKARLSGVVGTAGLHLSDIRYVNALALPGWMVTGPLTHRADSLRMSLDLWDRYGVPVSRWIEDRISLPFGLNLIAAVKLPAVVTRPTPIGRGR